MEKLRGLWSEVCWVVCNQGQWQGGHADRAHIPWSPQLLPTRDSGLPQAEWTRELDSGTP